MKVLKRVRVSPAMVVALVALFMAMGGTAFAQALIGGDDIIDGSITGADVKNNSLNTKDVAGLRGVDIRNGSITTKDIRDGTLKDEDIAGVSGAKVEGPVAEATNAVSADSAANADRLGDLEPEEYQTAIRWVRVNAGGTITEQSGGFSMQDTDTGSHWINTGETAVGKALIATSEWNSGTNDGSVISVVRCDASTGGVACSGTGADTPSHVFVGTTDGSGNYIAQPFYLVIVG